MAASSSENRSDSLSVPWVDAVRFIRQVTHDLRNHLNAIELQSAYIGELETNAKLKAEITRLREMISRLTSALQKLSAAVGNVEPTLIPYPASDFVEDLRKKISHEFPNTSGEITWEVEADDTVLQIDPERLQEAFVELFANAFRHNRAQRALTARVTVDKNRFLFTLQEPKERFELSTANWGREPLRKISQGHYGLGLNRVRTIVEAHGGQLHAQYDPKSSVLATTFTLPASRG